MTKGELQKAGILTRGNVAYDFNKSPFTLEVPYESGDVYTFVFSSELYMNKFYNALFDNREKISTSLSNRFGFTIVNDILCDLKLYLTIEKRGFLIFKNEEKIEWQKDIILNGVKLTNKK